MKVHAGADLPLQYKFPTPQKSIGGGFTGLIQSFILSITLKFVLCIKFSRQFLKYIPIQQFT